MKKLSRLASLLTPVGLLAACGGSPLEVGVTASAVTPPAPSPWGIGLRESLPSHLTDACPANQWVGYMLTSTGKCPGTSNSKWRVTKLFGPPAGAWAPDLDRFCRYTWTGAGAPDVAALPNQRTLRLERDCRVVVPLGQPTAGAGAELAAAHVAALGLPVFAAGTPAPSARVRIAIVDSSPDDLFGLPSGSGHGLAVGAMARRAGCMTEDGVGCPVITHHQGLKLSGGDFGYQSDVAQAIVAAIRAFSDAGTEDRLIVNLSLGWDPSYGSGPGPDVRVASYAVHTALQVAACEQVLVLAAAGNRALVSGGVGPMLPAGWEPDERLCLPSVSYAPLVHAIGGLTPHDAPLALARASSRPRLAAPAAWVTTALPGQSGYTEVLSGTSMAAASVSGIASLVWSLSPLASPEALMQSIYDNAVPLGVAADFEKEPWTWIAARVDACAAVAAVAPAALQPAPCVLRPAGQAALPDLELVVESEAPGLWHGPATPGATAALVSTAPDAPDVTLSPWAGPQPPKPPCPLCMLTQDGTLHGPLQVSPDSQVLDVFLRACVGECDDGDPLYEVVAEYLPDAWLKVHLPGLEVAALDGARLEAKVLNLDNLEATFHASEVLIEK